MIELPVTGNRLTGGTVIQRDGSLTLPAAGGGLLLDAMKGPGPRFLCLSIEVLSDHSQAFELRFYADEPSPRFTFRFGLLPRVPCVAVMDLDWLDGHILFPGHMPGQLKTVCHGSRIARDEISRAEFTNCACHHPVSIRLDGVTLRDERPEMIPLPDVKLVDEMGQLKNKAWSAKAGSLQDMKEGILREESAAADWPSPDWNKWGGFAGEKICPGSGFFQAVKREGRWHLADPDGYPFFSQGMDCVNVSADSRVDGIESLLDWLPDRDDPVYGGMYSRREAPWGEVPRANPVLFSFLQANLARAFGGDWYDRWQGMIEGQLKRAGINTLGNWSDPDLCARGRLPYVTSLARFPDTGMKIFRDFPDVFSPEYEQDAKLCAKDLERYAGDPRLIGWFLRNEPAWAFVDGLIIAQEVLRNPEPSASRDTLIGWLKERYGSLEGFNRAWNLSLDSFDALRRPLQSAAALSQAASEDLHAFSRLMIERYVTIPSQACREKDREHLNLGMRWAWISSPDVIAGWENFDVFSINCYALDPTDMLDQVAALGVDRPVIIGEFHHGALDAGLTATGLKGVTSQEERGIAFSRYCQSATSHPLGVGCHYFQCYDQFPLGRFDGENYNIGLFDTCFKPHEGLVRGTQASAGALYPLRLGLTQPQERLPQTIPMIAY